MPRDARQKCDSGIYHVIVRGTSRQLLFEESGDYHYYLNKMDVLAAETRIQVYAYALMPNHVHLLIHDAGGQLSAFMKKMGISYAQYFNKKYQRTGHLFQDRYKSEPVEDDDYLLTVYRYILRNPEKAGIAPADAYTWNSYIDYLQEPEHSDPGLLKEMIGDANAFREFMKAEDEQLCMEADSIGKDDAAVAWMIRKRISAESPTALRNLKKAERDPILHELKEQGITVRQLERLTGIGRGIIQRA